MKNKYFFKTLAIASLFSIGAMAQSENVGIGTVKPNESALLDLSSSNKGLLIPRMSAEQRTAISTPAQGLMVYQTGKTAGFYFFDGSNWKSLGENLGDKSLMALTDPWKLGGNDLTADPTAFVGTTSNHAFTIKVNNQPSGYIFGASSNTSFGYEAGKGVTGNANTSFGYNSLKTAATGESNVGVGYRSLMVNTSGYFNTAIGANAMMNNTTGYNNVAIGLNSMLNNQTGWNNVGLGMQTLQNNTIGENNIGAGIYALFANTTGSYNMGLGGSSLNNNTTGSDNMGVGARSLFSNTTGNSNSAVGSRAGYSNLSGSRNVFLGYEAGYNEITSDKLYVANNNTATPLIYGDFSAKYVTIGDVTPSQRNQGVATGGYNLLVKGGILTEKVKVAVATTGDWADYVFEPAYKLMSLENVEQFTKENKHLPNVPSADQLAKDGLDLGQTSKMFMEKIEELTLYVIEMNKEIKALKAENVKLKK